MFDNIGGKIKGLALVICLIGIIASVIFGIVSSDKMIIVVATIIIGSAASWVGSFVLYGFGELVENSAIIAESINALSKRNKKGNKNEEKKPKLKYSEFQHPDAKADNNSVKSYEKCMICGKPHDKNEMYSDNNGKFICKDCFDDMWICPKCGTMNQQYEIKCRCGERNPNLSGFSDEELQNLAEYNETDD